MGCSCASANPAAANQVTFCYQRVGFASHRHVRNGSLFDLRWADSPPPPRRGPHLCFLGETGGSLSGMPPEPAVADLVRTRGVGFPFGDTSGLAPGRRGGLRRAAYPDPVACRSPLHRTRRNRRPSRFRILCSPRPGSPAEQGPRVGGCHAEPGSSAAIRFGGNTTVARLRRWPRVAVARHHDQCRSHRERLSQPRTLLRDGP
jgi:hypothetical protein